jgi:hypothetical protein
MPLELVSGSGLYSFSPGPTLEEHGMTQAELRKKIKEEERKNWRPGKFQQAMMDFFKPGQSQTQGNSVRPSKVNDSGGSTPEPNMRPGGNEESPQGSVVPPPPPPTYRVESKNRFNTSIPLSSPAGSSITSGINNLNSTASSGSGIGGPDVGSDKNAPRNKQINIGIGGGRPLAITTTNGNVVMAKPDGTPYSAEEKVPGMKLNPVVANKVLNGDRETILRYTNRTKSGGSTQSQEITHIINDSSMADLRNVLSDMGYSTTNSVRGSSDDWEKAIDEGIRAYEADNGLKVNGLKSDLFNRSYRLDKDTVEAFNNDVRTIENEVEALML